MDALQSRALTSALPRAESSDARDDRGDDDATEEGAVLLLPAPAPPPPPNTLAFESTLSSERRPSTRPSDVAGEGSAFSVVVAVASVVWKGSRSEKKGRCERKIRFSLDTRSPSVLHETRASTPPQPPKSVPHSAMSAAVPMEKSLIDGEAGNDDPDGFASPVAVALLLLLFPFSEADERCESRRMSEDIVSRGES